MKTQITYNHESIQRAYKPDVALLCFDGDYGYELAEDQKLALIEVLERATSFSNFFDILPQGFASRYNSPERHNMRVLAQSYNGYTMWSAESRSDACI